MRDWPNRFVLCCFMAGIPLGSRMNQRRRMSMTHTLLVSCVSFFSGATSATIADHLIAIERDRMGLSGDLTAARLAVARLVALAR